MSNLDLRRVLDGEIVSVTVRLIAVHVGTSNNLTQDERR